MTGADFTVPQYHSPAITKITYNSLLAVNLSFKDESVDIGNVEVKLVLFRTAK
jgi:hypothetical protein